MTRQHICDVPGCGNTRLRRHRLCTRCFGRLPPFIRVGITEAHHQRRWPDHTALKHRAAAFLNLGTRSSAAMATPPAPVMPRVSAERSYAMNARLLGEAD